MELSDLDENALVGDADSPASRRRGSRPRTGSAALPSFLLAAATAPSSSTLAPFLSSVPRPPPSSSSFSPSTSVSGASAVGSSGGALDMPLLDQLVTQWANARRGSVDAGLGPTRPRATGGVRLVRNVTRQVSALEGESAIFRCELVPEQRAPELYWFHVALAEGRPQLVPLGERDCASSTPPPELDRSEHELDVAAGLSELRLHLIRPDDAGAYLLVALAGAPDAAHQIELLTLAVRPNPSQFKSPEFVASFTDLTVPCRAEQVVLHCKVLGVPPPLVRFYRDGKLIRPEATNGRVRIEKLGNRQYQLVIRHVTLADDAEYMAVAHNVAGSATCSAQLNVEPAFNSSAGSDLLSRRLPTSATSSAGSSFTSRYVSPADSASSNTLKSIASAASCAGVGELVTDSGFALGSSSQRLEPAPRPLAATEEVSSSIGSRQKTLGCESSEILMLYKQQISSLEASFNATSIPAAACERSELRVQRPSETNPPNVRVFTLLAHTHYTLASTVFVVVTLFQLISTLLVIYS